MLPMATSTTCRRNLEALRSAGWGLFLTPDRPERWGFDAVAIDNGAWGCFQQGKPWQPEPWQALVEEHGHDALFVIAPDVVCGGPASLELSVSWLPWCMERSRRVLLAVQDGMDAADLRPYLSDTVGLFIGGSTEWKEASLPMWGSLAAETGCWLHVGRVNSARRMLLCAMAGADSCDGTSATRFSKNVPKLTRAARRGVLPLDLVGVR